LLFFLRRILSVPMTPTAKSNRAVLFEIEADRLLSGSGIWCWGRRCGITVLLRISRIPWTAIPHIIMLINAINVRFLIFILTLSESMGFKGGFFMSTSIMWMYIWNWHSLIVGAYITSAKFTPQFFQNWAHWLNLILIRPRGDAKKNEMYFALVKDKKDYNFVQQHVQEIIRKILKLL